MGMLKSRESLSPHLARRYRSPKVAHQVSTASAVLTNSRDLPCCETVIYLPTIVDWYGRYLPPCNGDLGDHRCLLGICCWPGTTNPCALADAVRIGLLALLRRLRVHAA